MLRLLCLVWVIFLLVLPGHAQQHIYGFFHFPPFVYLDEKQQPQGYIVNQVMPRISAHSDHEFIYKAYPAKRFYAEIARGSIDVNISSKVPGLVELVHFGETPILEVSLMLFSKRSLADVKELVDIQGQRLGGLRGLEFLGRIKQIRNPQLNIQFQQVNNRNSLFKLLDKGRIDYAIDYLNPAQGFLRQQPDLVFERRELMMLPAYLVVPKSHPNGKQLLQELEQILLKHP